VSFSFLGYVMIELNKAAKPSVIAAPKAQKPILELLANRPTIPVVKGKQYLTRSGRLTKPLQEGANHLQAKVCGAGGVLRYWNENGMVVGNSALGMIYPGGYSTSEFSIVGTREEYITLRWKAGAVLKYRWKGVEGPWLTYNVVYTNNAKGVQEENNLKSNLYHDSLEFKVDGDEE
jgi:hypothetical protein